MPVIIDNPALRMCAHDGCIEVATGQPRSRNHCGPHYRSDVLASVELVKAVVIGSNAIVDARTGEDITPGGAVELDPLATVIPALIAGGHIRLTPKAEKKDAKV